MYLGNLSRKTFDVIQTRVLGYYPKTWWNLVIFVREVHVHIGYIFRWRLLVWDFLFECFYQLLILFDPFVVYFRSLLFLLCISRAWHVALTYTYNTGMCSELLFKFINLTPEAKQLRFHELTLHLESLLLANCWILEQSLLRRCLWILLLCIQDFCFLVIKWRYMMLLRVSKSLSWGCRRILDQHSWKKVLSVSRGQIWQDPALTRELTQKLL